MPVVLEHLLNRLNKMKALLDKKKGVYGNKMNEESLSLKDAIDHFLKNTAEELTQEKH